MKKVVLGDALFPVEPLHGVQHLPAARRVQHGGGGFEGAADMNKEAPQMDSSILDYLDDAIIVSVDKRAATLTMISQYTVLAPSTRQPSQLICSGRMGASFSLAHSSAVFSRRA